jgi:hypothetical protein
MTPLMFMIANDLYPDILAASAELDSWMAELAVGRSKTLQNTSKMPGASTVNLNIYYCK